MSAEERGGGSSSTNHFDSLIVGAGFAGLYLLHKCRAIGHSVQVIEAGSGVGGVWYWNRYPGAQCDIFSYDYSFSFSDEIQQEWVWTKKFATQPEILDYANFVADKIDARRDIRFNCRVVAADWNDKGRHWSVHLDDGTTKTARFLIMATGALSMPKEVDIPGLKDFGGETYYTSRWPAKGVDLQAKRVGVIGTGSSGIQVIPELAKEADELLVFQRTAQFTLPARNSPLAAEELAAIKANYPELRARARVSPVGGLRPVTDRKTFDVPEDERAEMLEEVWEEEGGLYLFSKFGDLTTDEAANSVAADFVRRKIQSIVEDEETAEALKPTGYPLGSRRLVLDTNFYETFNRDNVRLIDLKKDPISEVAAAGIQTEHNFYNLDVIVLATGFDAMTGAILAVDIRGREGRSLRAKWADGPLSYLGLMVEGFPNLFTITGPGSPSVLTNMITAIEQHGEWISDMITRMDRDGLETVEASHRAEEDWVNEVYELASGTMFMKADSFYLGANIPGKPRVFMPYVGGLGKYRSICDDVATNDYDGFVFDKSVKSLY